MRIPRVRRSPRAVLAVAALGVAALGAAPPRLVAQAVDPDRTLLSEYRFSERSADTVVVVLERRVGYWAEVTGPGTLLITPVRAHAAAAFLLPVEDSLSPETQHVRIYVAASGPHRITVQSDEHGRAVTVRLYRDATETRRIAARRDRQLAIGVMVGGGRHSGYRLDPTGGAHPGGGGDLEGCLMAVAGGRFATCIGVGRQSMPDANYTVTWIFLQEQASLATGRYLGDRRTDVAAVVRVSEALAAGPRHLSPLLLSVGLTLTQHLGVAEGRHGWSVYAAWLHSRLANAPETERLDSDRLLFGFAWLP